MNDEPEAPASERVDTYATLLPEAPWAEERLTSVERARVDGHIALAHAAARRIAPLCRGLLSRRELESVGFDALVSAARRFEAGRGSFPTYARKWIVCAMRDEIRAEARRRRRERLDHAAEDATDSAGPSSAGRVPVGLTSNLIGRGCCPSRAHDTVVACETALMTKQTLESALAELSDSKREIVVLHYFAGKTLREVAAVLGTTYAIVKEAHAKAKAWLAKRLARLRTTPVPMSQAPELPALHLPSKISGAR